ncbi:SDR family NAD(P)-dependent oxidoreductase [Thermus scotoductus]|uniref:SDR family NAD(P)-dependent oxidoreductase n=1 Tax=Thermus scotoductus TaxID=37636 RepID=UPI000F805EA9|nr:SDR family NAD(P)-dependent oxidoreductase [Thermus scotoductus]RTI19552.1 corticosteroid 11-beta-dehydrogenase [Thermus scotoductus]
MGAVLITGAGSGIGLATARLLAERGFRVYGGVRKSEDAKALSALGVVPLFLDVTQEESLVQARRLLEGEGLEGLVANAGIAVAGPLELIPPSVFRQVLEVNVLGAFATVRTFLPLLRKTRGRVVLMGSVSGLVALPLAGPYAASKFALEALADALRVELLPFGVRVVLVEPGPVATPIWERSERWAETYLEPPPSGTERVYGRYLEVARRAARASARRGLPPERVAEVVLKALQDPRPRARYLVAPRGWQTLLLRRLPEALRDRLLARFLA